VPFHIEISSSLRHARAFNLEREELRRTIIEPWLAGRAIELGDREWAPAKSRLKILEGPALDTPALSFGQGWANAERSASNVTREFLAAAREAQPPGPEVFVVDSDSPEREVAELLDGHEARAVDPESIRMKIEGRDPEIAAVIVVLRR
jgi:hypothetical protein